MYLLYMQCYVHMVLCACCTCGVMYIWCCVNDNTSAVVGMWCHVHVVHMVFCASGIVYMLFIWYCVRVVLCTCRACGVVYV